MERKRIHNLIQNSPEGERALIRLHIQGKKAEVMKSVLNDQERYDKLIPILDEAARVAKHY